MTMSKARNGRDTFPASQRCQSASRHAHSASTRRAASTQHVRPPMKLLPILAAVALSFATAHAQDSLPFPVKVGGIAAEAKAGQPFAQVPKPVSTTADLELGVKGTGMSILNVTPVNAKNEPVPGASPAVIILQDTAKGSLAKTLDGQKLKPGKYLLSVVADGKTASILVQLE